MPVRRLEYRAVQIYRRARRRSQFRHRVRKTASADVVDKQDWLASPSCQQRSITSWQRRSIPGCRAVRKQSRGRHQTDLTPGRRRSAAKTDVHCRAAENDRFAPTLISPFCT